MFYRRAKPDAVLFVWGWKTPPTGVCFPGGRWVWPVLQAFEFLSREPIRLRVSAADAWNCASRSELPLELRLSTTIQVSIEPELLDRAGMRLLGLPYANVLELSTELVAARLLQSSSDDGALALATDPEAFWATVVEGVEHDLALLGLVPIAPIDLEAWASGDLVAKARHVPATMSAESVDADS